MGQVSGASSFRRLLVGVGWYLATIAVGSVLAAMSTSPGPAAWLAAISIVLAGAYLAVYPLSRAIRWIVRREAPTPPRSSPGSWALANRLWGSSLCVCLLAAILVPHYAHLGRKTRIGKAGADVQTLAAAVSAYERQMGALPTSLVALTSSVSNARGEIVAPFLAKIPSLPPGFTEYHYERRPDGTFSITVTGDGATIRTP